MTGSSNIDTVPSYYLSQPSYVSTAIYDSTGKTMIRPLSYGTLQSAGEQIITWDGLDRYGNAQSPGTYQWKALYNQGLSRTLIANLGVQHPWTPMDQIPGNHSGPTMFYIDGTYWYLVASSSEGPSHIVQITPNADITKWTNNWGDGENESLEGIAGLALILDSGSNPRLHAFVHSNWAVPTNNAKVLIYGQGSGVLQGASYSLLHSGDNASSPSPMKFSASPSYGQATGIVVSYQSYNQVRFVTPLVSGSSVSFTSDISVTVTSPTYVVARNDGTAYAVSGSSVLLVNPSGTVTTVLSGLTSPGPIAYDFTNDDILVTINGLYVARYHSDGTFKENYGNTAGRSYGTWNANDFGQILSIYCDGSANWYVTDGMPRRTVSFNSSGTLLWQLLGPLDWNSIGTVDPADLTTCYLPLDGYHMAKCSINASTNTWAIETLYPLPNNSSYGGSGGTTEGIIPAAGEEVFWEVRHVSGQTFLLNRGGRGTGGQDCTVVLLRVDSTQLTPVAALISLHPTADYNNPPAWWIAAGGDVSSGHAASYTHFSCSWSDQNNNGIIDTSEIILSSQGNNYQTQNRAVDSNWNIYLFSTGQIWKIPNEGTSTVPLWNWDHATKVSVNLTALGFPNGVLAFGVQIDNNGYIYLAFNDSNGLLADQIDTPPNTWPNSGYHTSRLVKVDPTTGNALWSVLTHTDTEAAYLGQRQYAQVGFLRGIGCLANGNIVVLDADAPGIVFTQDGLFVGGLRDDTNVGTLTTNWQKLAYGSQSYTDSQNRLFQPSTNDLGYATIVTDSMGNVYLGEPVVQSMAWYQISGINNSVVDSGTIKLNSASAAQATGNGLSASYYTTTNLSGTPTTRIDSQIAFGTLTGNSFSQTGYPTWPNSPSGSFSAQWTGEIELPLGEQFYLVLYMYGNGHTGCQAKVILNGQTIIDAWTGITLGTVSGFVITYKYMSGLIGGSVGKLPLTIQFAAPNDPTKVHLHLYWQSTNFDLRHVPSQYLYSS